MAKNCLEKVFYLPTEAHDSRHEGHGKRELISMSSESFGKWFLLVGYLSTLLKQKVTLSFA